MTELPRAFALSVAQLGDPRIVWVLAKVAGLTLAVFAALAWASYAALPLFLSRWLDLSGATYALASLLLTILAAWLLLRIVALAVLQFFAGEVVRAVELRHYPAAAGQMRELPFTREVRAGLRAAGRALFANALAAPVALLLLFTAIGPALVFGLVNAVLLGRELQDMVWLRHPGYAAKRQPIAFPTRFVLGGVVALGLLVPFLGLLAPVIGVATATHLVHRRLEKTSR